MTPPDKVCARCGRTITWRKKWERSWHEVRYCGEQCRRQRLDAVDRAIEQAITQLAKERPSLCPSEAVRQVVGDDELVWRPLMERARMAARRLVERGTVVITQSGQVVEPSRARGPIRIRKTTDTERAAALAVRGDDSTPTR